MSNLKVLNLNFVDQGWDNEKHCYILFIKNFAVTDAIWTLEKIASSYRRRIFDFSKRDFVFLFSKAETDDAIKCGIIPSVAYNTNGKEDDYKLFYYFIVEPFKTYLKEFVSLGLKEYESIFAARKENECDDKKDESTKEEKTIKKRKATQEKTMNQILISIGLKLEKDQTKEGLAEDFPPFYT